MKSLSPFKKGLLGGLVALLVAGGLFLAGLVAAQQLDNPARIDDSFAGASNLDSYAVLEGSCQPICNQRGTLTVFNSSTTTTGRPSTGGYSGRASMHEICRQSDPESHFCSIQEIEHAWATTGVNFVNPIGNSWVDTGKLGSKLNSYHEDINRGLTSKWSGGDPSIDKEPQNCLGWWVEYEHVLGLTISPSAMEVQARKCDEDLYVTCCR